MEQLFSFFKDGAQVRTHSQTVQPGDIFVALPGTRTRGEEFLAEAVRRGARAVIYDARARSSAYPEVLCIAVDDPALVLGDLARRQFSGTKRLPRLVGITGTNGKTTIGYLLRFLLQAAGLEPGLIGTVGTFWKNQTRFFGLTTPDCLSLHHVVSAMNTDGVDTVLMEVSSHALEQKRTAGLPMEVGIFSNLTQDHLDYHHTMDAYFAAKARLFLPGPQQCVRGAVNVDDAYGRRLRALRPDLLGFGLGQEADLRGEVLDAGTWGMELAMHYQGQSWVLKTPLVGLYNASNLLACQAAGLHLGLTPEDMAPLAAATGAPGRLERVPNAQKLDIFVDYAHTPDALEKVASSLKHMGFSRLLVVFGCGGDRDAGKRPRMGEAVARYADIAVLTSDNPRTENPEHILDQIEPGLQGALCVLREVDRRKAIGLALEHMRVGDALLIAGKGHEEYQILGTQKIHFSDFEVVQEILA